MFYNIVEAKKIEICNLKHVNFLKKDVAVREIISEYTKMIRLLLTILHCGKIFFGS